MKKIKPLFFILIALYSIYTNAQPIFITDSLDSFILREMNRWNIPGLAIAIIKDGNIVLQKGYGVREFGKNEKVDENTLFQIASNTKAFTGTALALLHHRNQLNLDKPLISYIPWFKLYDTLSSAMVTPRDLLCHRIGMKTFQGDFLNWGSNLSRKEIIEHMALTKPEYPFRYQYGYCNAAYVTAGELIKYVTDTAWDDYLVFHFFKPLGLNRTNTSYNQMLNDDNACKPHTKTIDGVLKVLPLTNIDNMGASACINSCVADMAKWVQLQLSNGIYNNKQILPVQVIAETRKSHMVNTDVKSSVFKSKHFVNYGLGWQMYDYEGRRIIEHSGGSNGFVTKTEFVPEENLGVIVYTNTDANSLYDALCKQIIEAYFNIPYRNLSEMYFNNYEKNQKYKQDELSKLLKTASNKNKAPAKKLVDYTGIYHNDFYGMIEIKQNKKELMVYFSNHPDKTGTLKHIEGNKFLCYYSDLTSGIEVISFEENNGKISAVNIKVDDFIDFLSYKFDKK